MDLLDRLAQHHDELKYEGLTFGADLIKLAHAEITRLRAERFRWIPVGERLPTEQDGTVLCMGTGKSRLCFSMKWDEVRYVSHWAPIPPLPEKSQGERDDELWIRYTQGKLGGTTDINGVREAFLAGLKAAREQKSS